MNIRVVALTDAEGIAAIYRPIVESTSISFELSPHSLAQMRGRIMTTLADLPWVVSEDARGSVNGYVWASKHRERPTYRWSVNMAAHVREDWSEHSTCTGVTVPLHLALALQGHFSWGLPSKLCVRDREP